MQMDSTNFSTLGEHNKMRGLMLKPHASLLQKNLSLLNRYYSLRKAIE